MYGAVQLKSVMKKAINRQILVITWRDLKKLKAVKNQCSLRNNIYRYERLCIKKVIYLAKSDNEYTKNKEKIGYKHYYIDNERLKFKR